MPFALDYEPTTGEMAEAINYLLANFGPNISADPSTGQITGPTGIVVGYLYKYMSVKYADSADGSLNFSNSPTGRLYYGIRNSDQTTESTNPADYIWFKVAGGGFGSTKYLYYQTTGGRNIQFVVATTLPPGGWKQDDGTSIDLDYITALTINSVATATIYKWTSSGTPPSRPTTTTLYTWSTNTYTAPSGWSTTIPIDVNFGDYLWSITIPVAQVSGSATSIIDWTNTGFSIICAGYNSNGVPAGLTPISAYLLLNSSDPAPTGFPQTTSGSSVPTGWSSTVPSSSYGKVIWYSTGYYNSTGSTVYGIAPSTTLWMIPVASSIFQDIRSDNWNGSTPPTAGTPSTYGTAGYYIQRSTGNMFLNSVYGRGIAQFNGANTGTGGYTAAILANNSLGQSTGVEGYTNNTFLTSGALRAWNQSSGGGNAIYANHAGTGAGILAQSTSGIGVRGTGSTYGVEGTATTGVVGYGSSGGYGVSGSNTSGGTAVYANGPFGTNNSTMVSNLYAQYAQTMVGTAGVNQLRFVSGTSTGSSIATFSGTKPGGASTNVWMTMQIDGTTIYVPVWT